MTFGTAYGRLLQRSLLHVTANIQDTAQTEGSVKGKEFVYSLHDYCPQNSLSQINLKFYYKGVAKKKLS